jgi:large subunit ribosomal protein L15
MKPNDLRPADGSHRRRRRIGRGDGSGRGTYSGRGMKGQKSRSGGGVRRGFAGGTLPLMKSLPMLRGFTNNFRVTYTVVNLDRLSVFPEGAQVTPATLKTAGILKKEDQRVKILGGGTLNVRLFVSAHRFSQAAREAIKATGGSVEAI